jgi:hypothetical protein
VQELRLAWLALGGLLACSREPAPTWVRPPAPAPVARAEGSPRSCLALPGASTEAVACWVSWLAAPALAGRAAGSPGGATARAGIEAVLRDMSLGPGGEEAEFTQALPQGANVLALAVGGDPARADEVVMLAAHYDHLGVHGEATYLGRRRQRERGGGAARGGAADRRATAGAQRADRGVRRRGAAGLSHAGDGVELLGGAPDGAARAAGGDALHGPDGRQPVARGAHAAVRDGARDDRGRGGAALPDAPLAVRAMHLRLVEELPAGRQAFSDHGAFFAARTPVLFFSSGRSPHYHRTTDLPETLDHEKLAAAVEVVEAHVRWLADLPERPGWREAQPVTAGDAAVLADLLASASAGSREFNELARPVIRADLATLRRLSGGPPETALAEADAKTVIAASLRAQCLLAPDDEAPTATCLML